MIKPIGQGDNLPSGCNIAAMGASGTSLPAKPVKAFGVAFAAGAALLVASLANFLNHNTYPLLRPEVGLIVASIVGLAALMALWYVPQRQWGRSFLEGLLIALFVDLNSDSNLLALAAGVATTAFTAWRRTSLLAPLAMIGSVIFLTTVAGIGGRPDWINIVRGEAPGGPDQRKPAVVHLILDEHLGLEGFAEESAAGAELRDELRRFYTSAGFAVYGGAYSQHYNSANSIPYILNYGERLGDSGDERGVRTGPTVHLRALVQQGFRLSVLQSDYADVCTHASFYECVTYDSSSLKPTLAVPLSVSDRFDLVGHKFLNLSDSVQVGGNLWNVARANIPLIGNILPQYQASGGGSSTVGAIATVPLMLDRLRTIRPGDAYFAHLLLPHHPYALGRQCDYAARPWYAMRSPVSLEVRRRDYYEQVRCSSLLVSKVLDAIAKSPAAAHHVVIVHGDHGSRIAVRPATDTFQGQLSDADMIAGFSSLFAVRARGIPPTYVRRPQPIASLLGEFAKSGFAKAPAGNAPIRPVFLADRDLKPHTAAPLPARWINRLDRPVKGQ